MAENSVPFKIEPLSDTDLGEGIPLGVESIGSMSVDLEAHRPNPLAAQAVAAEDAALINDDPVRLGSELTTNGSHSRQGDINKIALDRTATALYEKIEEVNAKAGDKKQISKQDYTELQRLYKAAKGLDPDDAIRIGKALAALDKEFAVPVATTPTAGRIDAARKKAATKATLDTDPTLRSTWALDVERRAGIALSDKPSLQERSDKADRYAVETLMSIAPVLATVDATLLMPALSVAYNRITGKTLTNKQSVDISDMLQMLRTQLDDVRSLPAEKQEAEFKRRYGIILKSVGQIGLTSGSSRSVLDIIPAMMEDPTTFNVAGKTFTSDDLIGAGVWAEYVLGMLPFGGYAAKQVSQATRRAAAKFAVANQVANGGPLRSLGDIQASIRNLRPAHNPNTIGAALRGGSPADYAPNPFGMMSLRGNTGAGMDTFLQELDAKRFNATLEMNSRLYTDVEQDVLVQRVKNTINDAGGSLLPQYSEVRGLDNAGFRMSSVVGHSGQSGWDSPLDALYFAQDNLPMDSTTLMRRDLVTGEFEELDAAALKNPTALLGQPGEYFLKTDHLYKYDPEDRALFGVQAPVEIAMGGALSRALLDPASRMSKQMMDFARGAVNKEDAVKEAANSILSGNFLRLHGSQRLKVMKVLEDGDTYGKEFTIDEVMTGTATLPNGSTVTFPKLGVKETKAYMEARAYNNYLYEVANRTLRVRMEKDGWKSIARTGEDGVQFARPANYAELPPLIYDPRTKALIPSQDAVATRLPIMELHSPRELPNGNKYSVTLSTPDDLLLDLPVKVLNFNPGQVTRIYDENWFVRATSLETINGITSPKVTVVGTARTWKEAQQAAVRLNDEALKNKSGVSFEAGRDEKALKALAEGTYDFDTQGALLVSTRGNRLTRLDGSPARILDPLNAMNVARDVVANRSAWTDYRQSMKAMGQKMWPNNFKVDEHGEIIVTGSRTTDEYEQAKAFNDWLQTMESGADDAMVFKQQMVRLSQRLQESRVPEWIADPIARAMNSVPEVDPFRVAKSGAFLHQIALAGPRTLLLNALQPLFLAGLAPVSSLRALALDQWALHIAMLNRDNPKLDSILAGYLRVAGLGSGDTQFYKSTMEAYRMSGLPYSLDSHSFFRGTSFSMALKSTDGTMAEVVKGVVSALPKAGAAIFRGGEQVNLASTFMIAARRYRAKHPKADWSNPAVWSDIASDARALSLDMSKVNDLSYQRGWASIPFQYFAISHKALLAATGMNKSFAPDVKYLRTRMLLGGMTVYGAAGIPFGPELVDDALEASGVDLSTLPAEDAIALRNKIHGGLMDNTWNSIFTEDDGTPGSVQVAKATSLVNGVIDMFSAMLGEDATVTKVASGAAGSMFSTYETVSNEIGTLYERGDYTNPDLALKALAVLPEVTSGWSRYAKAQLGMELHTTLNKRFSPTINQTMNEAWAKGYFGFSSYREAEAWTLTKKMDSIKEDTKTDVEGLSRVLIRSFLSYGEDTQAARAELEKIKSTYVQSEYSYWVWQQAMKNVLTVQRTAMDGGLAKDKQDKIIAEIIKGAAKGSIGVDMTSSVMNSDEVLRMPKEEQDKLRTFLQDNQDQFNSDSFGSVVEGNE